MAEGLRTWTADGKLQMDSKRLTRQHSVYSVNMGVSFGKNTHVQSVSGMVNDGTWIVLPSVSSVFVGGEWRRGNLHETVVTVQSGQFTASIGGADSTYIFEVIRI